MVFGKYCSFVTSPSTDYFRTFICFMIISCAATLDFEFQRFDPSTYGKIKLEGNASFSSSKLAIELTTVTPNHTTSSFGRASHYKPMQLWDKKSGTVTHFTTHFSFIIDSENSSKYADGMAFFIAGTDFPFPVDRTGSGLGLLSRNQTFQETTNPFVAVEFDTIQNEWDPAYKHVGININSMLSVKTTEWYCSIEDGRKYEAWISYNFTTKMLSAIFTGFRGNRTIYQNISYEVDLRKHLPEWVTMGFSAATGLLYETHTLLSWNLSSVAAFHPYPVSAAETKHTKHIALVAGVTVGGCILLIASLGGIWIILWKRNNGGEISKDLVFGMSFNDKLGPKRFTYRELAKATGNFSEKEKLGEGGFGGVYRGFIKESNSHVAVKRISRESKQGIREYVSEVMIISRLRHRNLVQLVGWCHEKNAFLLIYEFMSNGSLDSHLFLEKNSLSWELRYKIALGLASALLYLHEEWEECVVHRDIKSSNVLLDSNFNAKLGDFGLARLVDHEKGTRTTILAGTMGYMAPEYATTGQASKESDVYSFGVVALEIACGRKPIEPMAEAGQVVLLKWVWELYGLGRLLEAADRRLGEEYDKKQMESLLIVGIWCSHPDFNLRPTIRQAIQVLKMEIPAPDLPWKMRAATSFSHLIGTSSSTHSCAVTMSDSYGYSSEVNASSETGP